MTAPEAWITLGARKILRLLETHEISAMKFAQLAGLSRVTLLNVLDGTTRCVSVDVALACKRGSKGAVDVEDFASSTCHAKDEDADVLDRLARAAQIAGRMRLTEGGPPAANAEGKTEARGGGSKKKGARRKVPPNESRAAS